MRTACDKRRSGSFYAYAGCRIVSAWFIYVLSAVKASPVALWCKERSTVLSAIFFLRFYSFFGVIVFVHQRQPLSSLSNFSRQMLATPASE